MEIMAPWAITPVRTASSKAPRDAVWGLAMTRESGAMGGEQGVGKKWMVKVKGPGVWSESMWSCGYG